MSLARRETADSLRRKAETLLSRAADTVLPADLRGVGELAHELAVHQAELEFQNQELQDASWALQQARDRYAALFEHAPAGYVVLDAAGIIRHTNLTWRTMLNRPEQEFRGMPFTEAMLEEDVPVFLARFRNFFRNPAEKRIAVRMKRRGQPPFHARIEAAPGALQTADGATGMELMVLVSDISDLQESHARLEEKVAEQERTQEVIRRQAARLAAVADILQYRSGGLQEFLDFALDRAIALSGSRFGYLYYYDEHRREFVLNSWSRDVMNECRVMEPQTCYQLDRTGVWGDAVRLRRPVMLNDFAREHPSKRGYPEGHVRLTRFLTVPVLHRGQIVAVVGVANKEADYDETDTNELTLLMDAVWKTVEVVRGEEERDKLRDQLVQAAKMESIGRLAGGVAHDFNNMLSVILGYAEMASLNPGIPDALRDPLRQITRAAQRSAAITKQLLAFARRQTVKPVPLDLNETVACMLSMLQRLIGEQVSLSWRPGEAVWPVKIDPAQLDQILANLCINARDAVGEAGTLTIATGNVTIERKLVVRDEEIAPGDYALLEVADTGCGMDAHTLTHLFEPFFTTKGIGKGTGLGLATVYGIVRQNGGFVAVESEPGNGAVFRIHLPRLFELPAARPEAPAAGTPPPLTRGCSVLLVEDDPALLELARAMLARLGYAAETASSPAEALDRFEARGGAFDLLVTDVVMPAMNGRDLARRLRERAPGLKVLYMSGYPLDVIAKHGMLEPGVHFLHKPFSIEAFAMKLGAALDS